MSRLGFAVVVSPEDDTSYRMKLELHSDRNSPGLVRSLSRRAFVGVSSETDVADVRIDDAGSVGQFVAGQADDAAGGELRPGIGERVDVRQDVIHVGFCGQLDFNRVQCRSVLDDQVDLMAFLVTV